jgi:cytochrome c biogenesis protein CcmG, thiol:disulfide interchange protein DsbE
VKPLKSVRSLIAAISFFALVPDMARANEGSTAQSAPQAPDFTLRTMDGELFTLSKHIGKGPIIMNFWATWCLPCMAEMKAMKPILESRKDEGILVLSLSVDDNKTSGKVKGHVRARKYPFTILMDSEKKVFDAYHAADMPHLFLLNKEGKIVYSHQGYKSGDEKLLVAQLDALKR